jgi:hypothetical protein
MMTSGTPPAICSESQKHVISYQVISAVLRLSARTCPVQRLNLRFAPAELKHASQAPIFLRASPRYICGSINIDYADIQHLF